MSILVIGTSHIAKQSVEEIAHAIHEFQPDIVAVELDAKRLQALVHKQKSNVSILHIPRIGVMGYAFAKIGQTVQQRLGKAVWVMPGSDMLTAVKIARKHHLKIALIDQDVEITLKRIHLTWKERFRVLGDIFVGFTNPKKELKRYGFDTFDLSKVPEDKLVIKLIGAIKKRYPSLYKVLIDERNKVMIRNVKTIHKTHPDEKILVVVGAGHKDALVKAFRT